MNWKETVHSEVNSQFTSNEYPKNGDSVSIRIRTGIESPVGRIWLRWIKDGVSSRIPMTITRKGMNFVYYSSKILITEERLQYSFELETPKGFYFYNRSGISAIHPVEDHDFVIIPDLDNPEWVPGAVFYQIFPDRFRKGKSELGVKTGEYQFDEGTTRELPWGTNPPEYSEGRCLDFFNGDLPGIKDSIPYLKELGVTAVYLNPIFEAKTNHRYDCTDYFHVDPHLGGDEALADLTKAFRENGIRCILDVSINHTGINHEWFRKASLDPSACENKFYYRKNDGSFLFWSDVKTLPQLNYNSDELRKVIWKNDNSLIRKFLKEPFLIDGWRFDVANEV